MKIVVDSAGQLNIALSPQDTQLAVKYAKGTKATPRQLLEAAVRNMNENLEPLLSDLAEYYKEHDHATN